MNVVIATDSFKGTMSSRVAGDAIAEGVLRAEPRANVRVLTVADGGEGTVEALHAALGGTLQTHRVSGPLGAAIDATYLISADGRRAIIEVASASGLTIVPPDHRDPMRATTFGTGQLVVAAIDAGCREVWIGAGGSATVDGGCGALQALGVRILAGDGRPLPDGVGGGDLNQIAAVDDGNVCDAVRRTQITVLCDVDNPMSRPQGAANVFAPQKGASPEQVKTLAANLEHLAACFRRSDCHDISAVPRGGAAGGLAGGFHAVMGAKLVGGADCLLDAVRFDVAVRSADLIITGEGRFDAQSLHGKLVAAVARRAQRIGVPLMAVVGCCAEHVTEGSAIAGIARVAPVYDSDLDCLPSDTTAARDLAEAARRAMEQWRVDHA